MAIFKSYITPGKTLAEVNAYFDANPEKAPSLSNEKRIYFKSEEKENGDLHQTEVWNCTEEEHESNGWGVIPADVVDALGCYATSDHLEIDPSEYEGE